MLDIYYTATSVFALIIFFIINRSIFSIKRKSRKYDEYQWFVQSIGLFLLVDGSYELTHRFLNTQWIFYDAVLYNITMVLTVFTCCRYVAQFLEMQNKKSRALKIFGGGFFVVDIIMLIVNFFTPVLFWIDEEGIYHTGLGREIGMVVLIIAIVLVMVFTACSLKGAEGEKKDKIISILIFSGVVSGSLGIQGLFPEFPCYSLGLVVGVVILYVRIHVAEQSLQLRRITALNKSLEENHAELEEITFELKKQKRMLEASNIAAWELIVKDGCRTRLRTDAKMKELMGIEPDTVLSEEDTCDMLVSRINPQDLDMFMEYSDNLKKGNRTECMYRWNHPKLGERYVRYGGTTIYDIDGELTCCGYHYDVTDVVNLEEELKITHAANEAKTKYIQNMGHEIRTPLNALFGFAQLLGMPDGMWDEEEKEKYNKIIYNSFIMMEMLVNDILDLTDTQNTNYRLEKSEFIVNEMCQNALMSVEFRRPGNVELRFTTDLDDTRTLCSDSRRIQQILVNYLTNACKHTSKGEIHLHVTDKEIPGKIVFSCTDTGHGVPADKAEAIFGRYTKLDNNVQGSGLGLNICNIIAAKLDAKVYLDTTYTDGARFKLEIAQ